MTAALMLLATNAMLATALLGVGLLADRFVRWPAVRHVIWVAVLLQLLLPAVISIGVTLPQWIVADGSVDVGGIAPSIAPLPEKSFRLATALVAVELAGAVLFLGLALLRSRRLFRLLRATQAADVAVHRRARHLADGFGLRRLPRIRVTDERAVPMLIALPIPTIVLSKPLLERLGDDELDALLCHELAHARRGDAWLRPVEMLATALYWWLPTVWIARGRLRCAEEAACDSLVVTLRPTAKRAYAEGLIKALELTVALTPSKTLVTGSADSRDIKGRIAMILDSSDRQAPRLVLGLVATFALVAALVGPTWAPAQGVDVLPLVRVAPVYPPRALQSGLEGTVRLQFTITDQGRVKDAVVVQAEPQHQGFEEAALRAILRWRYMPMVVDGKAVARVGVQTIITFDLEDQ